MVTPPERGDVWFVMRISALAGVALLLPTACSRSGDTPAAELRQIVANQWAAYQMAYEAGDAARLGQFYTDGVWLRGPDPWWRNARGRDAAVEILAETLPAVTVHDITFATEDLIPLGDRAFESGTWSEDYSIGTSSAIEHIAGGYTVLWERQGDGAWRISHLFWNVYAP